MEDLNSHGLHFDEFHKMRVLDPELASTTKDLKEECGTFLENMSDFRQMSDGFIAFSDKVSKSSKGGTPVVERLPSAPGVQEICSSNIGPSLLGRLKKKKASLSSLH